MRSFGLFQLADKAHLLLAPDGPTKIIHKFVVVSCWDSVVHQATHDLHSFRPFQIYFAHEEQRKRYALRWKSVCAFEYGHF